MNVLNASGVRFYWLKYKVVGFREREITCSFLSFLIARETWPYRSDYSVREATYRILVLLLVRLPPAIRV
jgi:hypothetical protein